MTDKKPWYILRDASGTPSLSATLVLVAFAVTVLAYFLSLFEQVGPVKIRPFDAAACGVFLGPILLNYWGRKSTEVKAATERHAIDKLGEQE